MSTEPTHELLQDRSPRQHLVECVLGVSLVALLVAPIALPAVLAADGATSAPAAVLHVLGATFLGYLAGLLILLWRADNPS